MSDMKCPFCQQELKYDAWNEVYMCRNPNCKHLLGFGTKELWQELIRTRKELDEAIDLLKMLYGDYNLDWSVVESDKVYDFLKQINQKEEK